MANLKMKLAVKYTQIRVLFLPIGSVTFVGDSIEVSIFGVTIYKRIGNKRKLLCFRLKDADSA